jgi:hypothetical protein
MRITLRTLIAGQCGLLNAQQQATLDERLQQHAAAKSLYQHLGRLRQSTTPRTPPLSGTGLGIDPASVAAYLQRQLPADQSQAFERLAIESDQVLDELLAVAALAPEMSGPQGLSSDRIERVLAIGMTQSQPEAVGGREPIGLAMADATWDSRNSIEPLAPVQNVALATTKKPSYRYRRLVAALIVTVVAALLVFPIGSRYLPKQFAPGMEDSVADTGNRQQDGPVGGQPSRLQQSVAQVSRLQDRAVMSAAWEVAVSEPLIQAPKGLELEARADRQLEDSKEIPSEISQEADRRIAMGDLSMVAGSENLLGDSSYAECWHGWIDSVSQRCQRDSDWRERLEAEIAKRPGNWQPVLTLLWQGVPQAAYDPIWRRWLLDALVHERLEIRVLASYQYARLTGMVPSIVDRAYALQSLSRWEERLMHHDPRP